MLLAMTAVRRQPLPDGGQSEFYRFDLFDGKAGAVAATGSLV
jgi:hypothetical protein